MYTELCTWGLSLLVSSSHVLRGRCWGREGFEGGGGGDAGTLLSVQRAPCPGQLATGLRAPAWGACKAKQTSPQAAGLGQGKSGSFLQP
jgi:hypothetical protein